MYVNIGAAQSFAALSSHLVEVSGVEEVGCTVLGNSGSLTQCMSPLLSHPLLPSKERSTEEKRFLKLWQSKGCLCSLDSRQPTERHRLSQRLPRPFHPVIPAPEERRGRY